QPVAERVCRRRRRPQQRTGTLAPFHVPRLSIQPASLVILPFSHSPSFQRYSQSLNRTSFSLRSHSVPSRAASGVGDPHHLLETIAPCASAASATQRTEVTCTTSPG
ncbi:hypothetical protein COCVIDRAFT_111990, partial [Bipolaris victoriae FI3]